MEFDIEDIEHTRIVKPQDKTPFWQTDARIAAGDTRRRRLKAAVKDARIFQRVAGQLSPKERADRIAERLLRAAELKAAGSKEIVVADLKRAELALKKRRTRTCTAKRERRERVLKKEEKRLGKRNKAKEQRRTKRAAREEETKEAQNAKLAQNLGRTAHNNSRSPTSVGSPLVSVAKSTPKFLANSRQRGTVRTALAHRTRKPFAKGVGI